MRKGKGRTGVINKHKIIRKIRNTWEHSWYKSGYKTRKGKLNVKHMRQRLRKSKTGIPNTETDGQIWYRET